MEKLNLTGLMNQIGVSNFPLNLWQFLASEKLIHAIQIENNDICDNSKQIIASNEFNIECWVYRPFRRGKRLKNSSVEDIIKAELAISDNVKVVFGATKLYQIEPYFK